MHQGLESSSQYSSSRKGDETPKSVKDKRKARKERVMINVGEGLMQSSEQDSSSKKEKRSADLSVKMKFAKDDS